MKTWSLESFPSNAEESISGVFFLRNFKQHKIMYFCPDQSELLDINMEISLIHNK